MTWRNPIFMIVFFGIIWYLPGVILRRIAEHRAKENAAENQARKISSLYPKAKKVD